MWLSTCIHIMYIAIVYLYVLMFVLHVYFLSCVYLLLVCYNILYMHMISHVTVQHMWTLWYLFSAQGAEGSCECLTKELRDVSLGYGVWDMGCGTWGVGHGMWDMGCGNVGRDNRGRQNISK